MDKVGCEAETDERRERDGWCTEGVRLEGAESSAHVSIFVERPAGRVDSEDIPLGSLLTLSVVSALVMTEAIVSVLEEVVDV